MALPSRYTLYIYTRAREANIPPTISAPLLPEGGVAQRDGVVGEGIKVVRKITTVLVDKKDPKKGVKETRV
ncbi:MAG: hypothetical protein IJZ86_08355 [Bacteroides sp.]|nr:hypothetical protein [Bacteroides sp.]